MSIPYLTLRGKPGARAITLANADGAVLTLCVSCMWDDLYVKLHPTVSIPIDDETGSMLLAGGFVKPAVLAELMRRGVDTSVPLLQIVFPDGSVTIVDGHEAYVARRQAGATTMLAKQLPQSVWSKFLVTGVPFTQEQLAGLASQGRLQPKMTKH